MKKNIFIILFTLLCININSQKLLNSKKQLLKRVILKDSLDHLKIKKFLANNKQIRRTIKQNNKSLVLYKILNGKPIYKSTDNDNAALATKTNMLHPGGSLNLNLDGTGITVGVWDGGPAQNTHTEFQNIENSETRITNIENLTTEGNTGFDDHATHVSGTIGAKGVIAKAKGMAPNVSIITYNFNNDSSEMVTVLNNPNIDMFLSNHSYGVPIDQGGDNKLDSWIMGAYGNDAREIDDIARSNPYYLIVASAGNSGQSNYPGGLYTGFDKLTTDKNAKNNLVVANASPEINPFTKGISSLDINPSSSKGPTDDLRIKPDIAGDGTGLYSTVQNDAYDTYTGTSMAAPNVTGSLVLLQQYYKQLNGVYMKSSTLKNLVCHTALDDVHNVGPDPAFGWGLLDAEAAANTIKESKDGISVIEELTLNNTETYQKTFSATAGENVKISICWTDVKGVATTLNEENLNNPTPKLVNDLDIRLLKDGNIYYPWKLNYSQNLGFSSSKEDNNVDNIERIDLEVPETGVYQVIVSHKGNLQSSEPFQPLVQDFSLILRGNGITLNTDNFNLNSHLNIWPNPANTFINVNFKSKNNSNIKISIFDLQGRLIYNNSEKKENLIFNEKIPVSQLNSGVYLLNLQQGNFSINKKIIIE